ncbi:hypothetical protein BLSTO_06195 [Blastocystis sp. subtype 1]
MWAKSLKMVGMKSLKRVVIWDNCFRECVDGSFVLEKCPKIRELVIGDFSFLCFKTCSIEKCPMLERVSIGRFREFMSFSSFATTSLRMTSNGCVRGEEIDLRKLRVASFGSRCFQGCQSAVFEDLPALEVIVIGMDTFKGRENADPGLLSMKNLPKLVSLTHQPIRSFTPVYSLSFYNLKTLRLFSA